MGVVDLAHAAPAKSTEDAVTVGQDEPTGKRPPSEDGVDEGGFRGEVPVRVGVASAVSGEPQALQKRLSEGFSAWQDGHSIAYPLPDRRGPERLTIARLLWPAAHMPMAETVAVWLPVACSSVCRIRLQKSRQI